MRAVEFECAQNIIWRQNNLLVDFATMMMVVRLGMMAPSPPCISTLPECNLFLRPRTFSDCFGINHDGRAHTLFATVTSKNNLRI